MNDQFARDVMTGLSADPKYLSSKYFYDQRGDALFQRIMGLEEYYLTRSEYQILDHHKNKLLEWFSQDGSPFDLVEFGAGDGLKTKVLLEHFKLEGADFIYKPIDISQNALNKLSQDLSSNLPGLAIEPLQGEYFQVLGQMGGSSQRKKVILFLGSNIGNFLKPVAMDFLGHLSNILSPGDHLLLGVDMVKDPRVIKKAYDDSKGVTRAFNLNLLRRINRELGGNFELDNFIHYPVYNPSNGESRSYLVSTEDHSVTISKLNASFHFRAWETIAMELSQKYDQPLLEEIASTSGFIIKEQFSDSRQYFSNVLLEVQ